MTLPDLPTFLAAITALAAAASPSAAARYLEVAAHASRLYSTLDAISAATRRRISFELGNLARQLSATPLDVDAIERELSTCEAAAARASRDLATGAPPPPEPHVREFLEDLGHNAEGLARGAASRKLERELAELADEVDRMARPFVLALDGITARDPTELDRLARHALADVVAFRAQDGGAFGPPPFDLGLRPARSWASNERPDALLVRIARSCGVEFPPPPPPRHAERERARREHATATRFGAFGPGAEAADKELERKIAASLELDRRDHVTWVADVNTELARVDAALAGVLEREGVPMHVRVCADQVRRALRGWPTIRGLEIARALELVEEHGPLVAPAEVAPATRELVRLRVQTARGIPSRMRAGLRFDREPRLVEVTPEVAAAIRADDGLDVVGESTPAPAPDDARKSARLRAERRDLETRLAELEAERDRRYVSDGRPVRLRKSRPAPAPSAGEGREDFGGDA